MYYYMFYLIVYKSFKFDGVKSRTVRFVLFKAYIVSYRQSYIGSTYHWVLVCLFELSTDHEGFCVRNIVADA